MKFSRDDSCLRIVLTALALMWCFVLRAQGTAGENDWPQWRFNAQRGGASPRPLADTLTLAWKLDLPVSEPAWPTTQDDLQFDVAPNIVVQGQHLLVGSNRNDCMSSYATRSGELRWRFHTDGPIRFAAAANDDSVYFTSDDGYLYCLELETGQLRWRVPGGPARRMVLGNQRMVSVWPARGAPVLCDGHVYFAASLWPFMGLFVHCVDAQTGDTIWMNSGDGMNLTVQPHGAPSFATVAPQGHLVVQGRSLIVPGGRSVPAVFDRLTGELLHFVYHGKRGDYRVFAAGEQYFVDGGTHQLSNGHRVADVAPHFAMPDKSAVLFADKQRVRIESDETKVTSNTTVDFRGKRKTRHVVQRDRLYELEASGGLGDPVIVTGDLLWTVQDQQLTAHRLDRDSDTTTIQQQLSLPGKLWDAVAADQRLFVVTRAGELLCFAPEQQVVEPSAREASNARNAETQAAHALMERESMVERQVTQTLLAKIRNANLVEGYALLLGCDDLLVSELFKQTRLKLVVLEPNPERAIDARKRWQSRGWYGRRLALLAGTADSLGLPPYFANLIVCGESQLERFFTDQQGHRELLNRLRPYGGTLLVRKGALGTNLRDWVERQSEWTWDESPNVRQLHESECDVTFQFDQVIRPGPLSGAGSWTHQYGDATQSGVSRDERVQAPLGVLWFGGTSHAGILPRHGHGPSPQVAGGRIVVEGADLLRCLDVYTGRLLWECQLPGVGQYYDSTRHFPGAGEIGSNYVTLPEQVYVVYGAELLELNAETGRVQRRFDIRQVDPTAAYWGHLAVSGEYLIVTTDPLDVSRPNVASNSRTSMNTIASSQLASTRFASGSRKLVVFHRSSGKRLWQLEARHNFRHNAIVAGAGRVFVIDRLSEVKRRKLARRGIDVPDEATLSAYDLATGNRVWQHEEGIFGTFLGYAEDRDILLQGGSVYRDRAYDESDRGLVALRGADGKMIWEQRELVYGGPCLIWKDRVITNGKGGFALDLLTGDKTGWTYDREYGCNTAIGCQNMLTFRSGAAGFYDLQNDSGTGNFGGFRSSCTNNLIPADGVLAVPDYTRTCNCAYQNQTSLALVHSNELDYWTFDSQPTPGRLGINLGANGDRRAKSGTLWLEYPRVGGGGGRTEPEVTMVPNEVKRFRVHSALMRTDPTWIYSSGIIGLEQLTIECQSDEPQEVSLYFSVPSKSDLPQASMRIGRFRVRLQDDWVLNDFSPRQELAGERHGLKKQCTVMPVDGKVTIRLEALEGQTVLCGVELKARSQELNVDSTRQPTRAAVVGIDELKDATR